MRKKSKRGISKEKTRNVGLPQKKTRRSTGPQYSVTIKKRRSEKAGGSNRARKKEGDNAI